MSNLIASMARFSAAMTLFGVEQLEKSLKVAGNGEDLSRAVDDFEKTLNSLTDLLTREIDDKKQETLESVTKVTEDTVKRTMGSMEAINPREMLKASTDLLQKAAAAVEKATGTAKSESAEPAAV
jgi:hypothetical protein